MPSELDKYLNVIYLKLVNLSTNIIIGTDFDYMDLPEIYKDVSEIKEMIEKLNEKLSS